MSNNKQSSIDWLVEKMLTQDWYTYKSLEYIKQAKAMHKEEHKSTYIEGFTDGVPKFEQYYNETFGVTMSNNKQSMKTHLKTTTILIGILLLGLAIAINDAVFYGVLALSVLGIMYAFIYLTIIRNQGNK
jgi:hypothetical protein